MPWLQVPFLPHALGGLGGRTAPLQVLLAPQEETLAVYATYKLPDIALVVPPWMFLAPPAEQGYAGLRVQLRQVLPVASADDLFHLLLPLVAACWNISCSITTMWAIFCPLVLDCEEELYIHYSLHFSNQPLHSSVACCLVAWNFSLLLLYSATISL